MPAVDSGLASWLKAQALYTAAVPAGAAAWADIAGTAEILSPIALKANAATEAQRQADLFGKPLVRDAVLVQGLQRALLGQVVQIVGDRYGYGGAGKPAFVIQVEESADMEASTLHVLRPIA